MKTFTIHRDDMLELTRRMNLSRHSFQRIAGCYLDRDGEIEDTVNVNFLDLSEAERKKKIENAKTVPFGRTNDQLVGYLTPTEKHGDVRKLLTGLLKCGLKNDLLLDVLYEEISGRLTDGRDKAIFVYYGSYDIKRKARDGEFLEDSEDVYDFLIVTVSPYDEDYELFEAEFGFLYPAYHEQSMAMNAVSVYTRSKRAEEPAVVRFLLEG